MRPLRSVRDTMVMPWRSTYSFWVTGRLDRMGMVSWVSGLRSGAGQKRVNDDSSMSPASAGAVPIGVECVARLRVAGLLAGRRSPLLLVDAATAREGARGGAGGVPPSWLRRNPAISSCSRPAWADSSSAVAEELRSEEHT